MLRSCHRRTILHNSLEVDRPPLHAYQVYPIKASCVEGVGLHRTLALEFSRLQCYGGAFVKATNEIEMQDKWIADEDRRTARQ
jgi:hypothetical protein